MSFERHLMKLTNDKSELLSEYASFFHSHFYFLLVETGGPNLDLLEKVTPQGA